MNAQKTRAEKREQKKNRPMRVHGKRIFQVTRLLKEKTAQEKKKAR